MPKPTVEERFWSKVERGESCWRWTGPKTRGYGQMVVHGHLHRAHRLAYAFAVGPIPSHLVVMHTCDNPECVNPQHLRLGTQGDNMRDMVGKGRGIASERKRRTHCPKGHEYTAENTIPRGGSRQCRQCHTTIKQAWQRRDRAKKRRAS